MNTSWLEISRDNIIYNIKSIKSLLDKGTRFIAVVKSNAYGHGIVEIAKIAEKNGADMIGVISLEEAKILRINKIKCPILILGYVPLENIASAVKLNCHLTVYNKETVKKLGSLSGKNVAMIHIKIETGTNRQGILLDELSSFLKLISRFKNINIYGISSHFADVEDTTDHTFAKLQIGKFGEAIKICEKNGIYPEIKHIAATAATLIFPESHFNAIRIGIGMYGLWPSNETKVSVKERNIALKLKPALTWKTIIAQIKKVTSGEGVGYGLMEQVKQESKIAVLPAGYWDGYGRALSGISEVLIKGKRCKVLGRICMNIFMVDITNIAGARLEDEVVLLGKQGEEEITAEEIAGKSHTINYEIVTRINPSLPRFYI